MLETILGGGGIQDEKNISTERSQTEKSSWI